MLLPRVSVPSSSACCRGRSGSAGGPGAAHGDGRRPGAAGGGRGGAGVGEHPVERGVRADTRLPLRDPRARPGPVGGALDRRRSAHRLLPRRRHRAETRTGGRRAAHPGHRGPAGGRRRVRHGGARRPLPGHRRLGGGSLDGVGGADGHRHRLRARRPRGALHPPALRAAGLPADPRRRRRPRRDPGHRHLLHRRPEPRRAGRGIRRARRLLPAPAAPGARLVVVRAARRHDLGADVQRRGPRHGGRGGDGPDPAHRPRRGREGFARRSGPSTCCVRSRPVSRCRCSPCSPQG